MLSGSSPSAAETRQYIDKVLALNGGYSKPKKAAVQTFGCQQNVSDSERISGMLSEMGYEMIEDPQSADLVIFNTCAVREHAEQRVFGFVGALKAAKEQNPGMIIGVCGCMTQQEHIAEKIKKSYPYVDLVFGTHVIHKFPQLLFELLSDGGRVFDIEDSDGIIAEGLPVRREGSLKAWLPVMYGCNNFCSYCIVPYVRGRERSREPELILEEARGLVADGFKEITLLGQNVNSYGRDLPGDEVNFARLLRWINEIEGDFRIRFMTSHPKDATQELLEAMASCDKVSKHLHLPFQAGSNRILKLMNRSYTKESYLALASKAKELMPGISLTSDIIVGFPGETYEEFLETVEVIKEVEFDNLFTFIYSKRRGTPAEKLPDEISHKEKSAWFAELLKVQNEITLRRFSGMVGNTYRVLCEGADSHHQGEEPFYTGRTDGNIIVGFTAAGDPTGRFVNVKITRARNFMLVGEAE